MKNIYIAAGRGDSTAGVSKGGAGTTKIPAERRDGSRNGDGGISTRTGQLDTQRRTGSTRNGGSDGNGAAGALVWRQGQSSEGARGLRDRARRRYGDSPGLSASTPIGLDVYIGARIQPAVDIRIQDGGSRRTWSPGVGACRRTEASTCRDAVDRDIPRVKQPGACRAMSATGINAYARHVQPMARGFDQTAVAVLGAAARRDAAVSARRVV